MKFQGSKVSVSFLNAPILDAEGCSDCISLEKCKAILEGTGLKYADEELVLIREFFCNLARIGLDNYGLDKGSSLD
jgi:hypothetical protein